MTSTALRVLGIVPARGGSKRVPRKNVRMLGGKPLVARAIECGLAASSLARVVVSSDDAAALAIAEQYARRDARCLPVARPPEISTDTAAPVAYVQHALRVLAERGERFDAICILQPSSPFTLASDVDATVALLANTGADSAVSVVKLDHAIHPIKLKRLVGDKLEPFLEEERGRMQTHELPELYVRNCAVYVSRVAVIEQGRVIGDDCRAFVMPRERSIDINDELDFAFAEFLAARTSGVGAG